MSDLQSPPKTHNNPPVEAPSETALLDDLKARYPKAEETVEECLVAAATYPDEVTDPEQASKMQALIKKMTTEKAQLKAARGVEKKPWDTITKIVHTWFVTKEEKLDAAIDKLKARHTKFLEHKEELDRQERERIAEQERQRLAELERQAEERKWDAIWAEARAENADYDERKARERAEEEERKAREAKAAAEAAAAEEKRLADEKKARDRAERERNEDNLKQIRRHMKDVERLNTLATEKGDDADEADLAQLDALAKPGGVVSVLVAPVRDSILLSDEQKEEVANLTKRIAEIRTAIHARLDAKERRRRAKAQKEEEEREAERRKAREAQQKADEEERERVRLDREKADRAAQEARDRLTAAKGEVKDAVKTGAAALTEAKGAQREATQLGRQAEKQEGRSARADARAEADPGAQHRGDMGTTSSLTYVWKTTSIDRDLIPLDQLRPYLHDDAISAAVTKWKNDHQAEWSGREVVKDALPGVVFTYEPGTRVI